MTSVGRVVDAIMIALNNQRAKSASATKTTRLTKLS